MILDSHFPVLLQQQAQPTGSFAYTMILMVGFMLLMYFILWRPQAKQQKEHKKMLDALRAGDKVITTGGIWGEVDQVEAHRVRLKVADKTKIFISRSAVAGFQSKDNAANGEKS